MHIRNLSLYVITFCAIFSVQACAKTASVPPASAVFTAAPDGQTLTVPPVLVETDAATTAAEIVVPPNAPWVVYVKGGNIWLWGAASSSQQLTRSGSDSAPKISDDAQVIAFIRNGELWAVDASGINERLLVSSASGPRQFDFAPHTHDIYFNTALQDDLSRVNADTAEVRPLLNAAQGGEQFFFSPDGKKIVLPRNDQINVVNVDGSGLKTVFIFPPVMMYSEINYIPEIVWLPDGSGFKTVIPAQDQLADPTALTQFMFISADGTIVARLAEFAASPAFANRPFISPDGSRVLYTKARDGQLELHIIDAGTADQSYFSHAANAFGILGWAPDSAHVVYWLDDRRRIWLGPQASDAIALSDVTFADNLTWVDAQHYLFTSGPALRFGTLGQPGILLDDGLNESIFDFTTVH